MTVTLAVTDNEGAIGLVSGSVTVTSGSGNTAPTASFTSECTDLGCTFVASASDDGAIASYRWDFGDGTDPATGENVTHTYAAEGNYNVVLVVTDDLGASTSVTETVAGEHDRPVRHAVHRPLGSRREAADGGYTLRRQVQRFRVQVVVRQQQGQRALRRQRREGRQRRP